VLETPQVRACSFAIEGGIDLVTVLENKTDSVGIIPRTILCGFKFTVTVGEMFNFSLCALVYSTVKQT
jgi:hypothetical protein